MRENEIFTNLIAIIEAAEPSAGIPNVMGQPGVPVYQAAQPTQEGIPNGPTAWLQIIAHRRIGFPGVLDYWDEDNEVEVHTETEQYETTFQLSALVRQDPAIPSNYTAADVVNAMSYIMQSVSTQEKLQAVGLGIMAVKEIRTPAFIDDYGRFEKAPSFDFIITHKLVVTTTTPVIESTEFVIASV